MWMSLLRSLGKRGNQIYKHFAPLALKTRQNTEIIGSEFCTDLICVCGTICQIVPHTQSQTDLTRQTVYGLLKRAPPKSIRAGFGLLCLFDRFLVLYVNIHLHLYDIFDRVHGRIEVNAEILAIDLEIGAK